MCPRQVIPLNPERKYYLYNLKPWLVPPEASVTTWIDMSAAKTLRRQFESTVHLTYTHLFIKATALALKEQPEVNAVWTARGILLLGDIRIGVTVNMGDYFPSVVIENPQSESLPEIAWELDKLIAESRSKEVRFSLVGRLPLIMASLVTAYLKSYPPRIFRRLFMFQLSNFGQWGIDRTIGVITRWPLLTLGNIADRVVAINGALSIRPTISFTLLYDCRVIDDVQASRFLARLKALLENPESLS